jgi:hypothetical protein
MKPSLFVKRDLAFHHSPCLEQKYTPESVYMQDPRATVTIILMCLFCRVRENEEHSWNPRIQWENSLFLMVQKYV